MNDGVWHLREHIELLEYKFQTSVTEREERRAKTDELKQKMLQRESPLSVRDLQIRYKFRSKDTAYELVYEETFPSEKSGGQWRIPLDELVIWEQTQIEKCSPSLTNNPIPKNGYEREFHIRSELEDRLNIKEYSAYARLHDECFPSMKVRSQWLVPDDLL